MREKPGELDFNEDWLGITPACAGKTISPISTKMETRDHPRVCGKNSIVIEDISPKVGSPPRVREKLYLLFRLILGFGITPACAGKTGV